MVRPGGRAPAELADHGGDPTPDVGAGGGVGDTPDRAAKLVQALATEAEAAPKIVGQAVTLLGTLLQERPDLAASVVAEDPWLLDLVPS